MTRPRPFHRLLHGVLEAFNQPRDKATPDQPFIAVSSEPGTVVPNDGTTTTTTNTPTSTSPPTATPTATPTGGGESTIYLPVVQQ